MRKGMASSGLRRVLCERTALLTSAPRGRSRMDCGSCIPATTRPASTHRISTPERQRTTRATVWHADDIQNRRGRHVPRVTYSTNRTHVLIGDRMGVLGGVVVRASACGPLSDEHTLLPRAVGPPGAPARTHPGLAPDGGCPHPRPGGSSPSFLSRTLARDR